MRRSSCAKGAVVEAGRIELPSEETNDRERSCFSHVHLCLVVAARNGRRNGNDQPDRSRPFRSDGADWTSLLCDDRYPPVGEAGAIGYLTN